jgi:DNA-binding transcriptional ArsR family regulator
LTFLQRLENIPHVSGDRTELRIEDPAVLAALYEPLRYRLFRLLETPRSVAELAAEVELPANRLYYHLRRLVDVGLVRQVDARANGRHTERIYGRAAARLTFAGDLDVAYGGGLLRGIADELDAGLQSVGQGEAGSISYHATTLTEERAHELEERLRELLAEYVDADDGPDGARYGVLGVLAPLPEARS